jgi:hypothetical protein
LQKRWQQCIDCGGNYIEGDRKHKLWGWILYFLQTQSQNFTDKGFRCTNFTNLFFHETLHVWGTSWSCSKAVYNPVWHITLLSVQWINSWWWTDELSETRRVSSQNKFVKLVHLVGFITKKFVTMHGHMNVKFGKIFGKKFVFILFSFCLKHFSF